MGEVGGLQGGDVLAAEASHLVHGEQVAAACLIEYAVELPFQFRYVRLGREEDGFGDRANEELVVAAAVGHHV